MIALFTLSSNRLLNLDGFKDDTIKLSNLNNTGFIILKIHLKNDFFITKKLIIKP